MTRSLKLIIVVWFSLAQLLVVAHPAMAQSGALVSTGAPLQGFHYAQFQGEPATPSFRPVDVDPPLIEHDVISQAEADTRQTFVATVVDDGELDGVFFFYRFAGELSFSRSVMTPLSASSTYVAQIPTDPNNSAAIEYYIQASDLGGNRTLRGYTFSPLVRDILPAEQLGVASSQKSANAQVGDSGRLSRTSKILYTVGGVLILGLIAGAASSSGGDGSPGPVDDEPCGPSGCRLSVTAHRPF